MRRTRDIQQKKEDWRTPGGSMTLRSYNFIKTKLNSRSLANFPFVRVYKEDPAKEDVRVRENREEIL